MIGCNVNRFCSEPLDLIENFGLAMNSQEMWDCHHRLEIIDGKVTSKQELIDKGLYYGRPASELIFLRRSEHSALHGKFDKEKQKKLVEAGIKASHSPEAIAKMVKKRQKTIIQLTKSGGFVKEYESGKQASLETGIARSNISACAKGRLKSTGGFVWKYK